MTDPQVQAGPAIPEVGEVAPDFALPDADGVVHRLADQRGRWTVVYFYPADDTPGCTTEACGFRDATEAMTGQGATVWGISPQGQKSKAAFRDRYGLTFPLLADVDHGTAEAYGSWVERMNYGKTYMGIARRTFLIDPEGRVAHVWPKVKPEGHAADVLATLEAARAGRGG
ncbi:MAG TPA: peroxiredoxin [Candidatus Sulfotelmatobacter sp.]|nr:peroxiredoxin [Candidatus Sulfotelmatobacter sp.]